MGVFLLAGCNQNKESKRDETIVLKENKSVCNDILVESEVQGEYSRLYYYDYESGKEIFACSQANCNHRSEEHTSELQSH